MLTLPASSSVLSGSLLIKHLSLLQAQMPPCALAGIYLSTSESSVDLSSQCSGGLGSGMISTTRIKSKAQRLDSALCCFNPAHQGAVATRPSSSRCPACLPRVAGKYPPLSAASLRYQPAPRQHRWPAPARRRKSFTHGYFLLTRCL